MDTLVTSFVKCGRTWLTMLLGKYYSEYFDLDIKNDVNTLFHIDNLVKFNTNLPKISRSHAGNPMGKIPDQINSELLDWSLYNDKKIIFLVRNPKDIIVSFYFEVMKRHKIDIYRKKEIGEKGISCFIRDKKGGIETIVKYFELWDNNKDKTGGFLLVRYEDLRNDTENEFIRILKFIGYNSELSYKESESELSLIENCDINIDIVKKSIDFCSFDNMHKMEEECAVKCKLSPGDINDSESYKTRKGIVGGYKNYLTEEDIKYINNITKNFSDSYKLYKEEETK